MIGQIFITRSGYDPQLGKHVKDPYLGDQPSLGACRPDIRRKVGPGDHLFVISGKVPGAPQFVMGGFEVEGKMSATEAYRRFPQQRLRLRTDGQLDGNVIVDADGLQHPLDTHNPSERALEKRLQGYIVGRNLVALVTPEEIARGREQTLSVLSDIFQVKGSTPKDVVGRFGHAMTDKQVESLRLWLQSIKQPSETPSWTR